MQSLVDFWEGALWASGFFGRGGSAEARSEREQVRAAAAMDKLRTLILRAQPSTGEAGLLRGALQALEDPPGERRQKRAQAGSAAAEEGGEEFK